jgi:TPR repeat protein
MNNSSLDKIEIERRAQCAFDRGHYAETMEILHPILNGESAYALLIASWIYEKGLLGPVDVPKAEACLRHDGLSGNIDARFRLGCLLRDRGAIDDAEREFQYCADHGHAPSMVKLANIFLNSKGNRDREEEALALLCTAAEMGNFDAKKFILINKRNRSSSLLRYPLLYVNMILMIPKLLYTSIFYPRSDSLR